MTSLVLSHTNGSTSGMPSPIDRRWMRQTVRQFFGDFNWNDNSPEVEELRQSTLNGQQPLSLALSVQQFFGAIDWDGGSIASPIANEQPPVNPADAFTLEDFSDLF